MLDEKKIRKHNKKEYINCLNCFHISNVYHNHMSKSGGGIDLLHVFCRYMSKRVSVYDKQEDNHCVCFLENK